ncbi:MAG: NADH-quinone oxidoreductase subunit N [Flavobacteriales bacterium]|nr:NADH-quinone oxidoreductase subunit N [Flavobacteriales bacterium]
MSALILTSVLGVLLLYLGLFGQKKLLVPVGVLGLLAAIGLFVMDRSINVPMFAHMVSFDRAGWLFSCGMLVVTVLIFLFGADYYARQEENVAEQYALMIFSLTGALLLTSYTNLLMLFLGIEILSIPLYIMAGGKRDSMRSSEASFKYFLLGSFASAFLLMGIALIYGVAASFDLGVVKEVALRQLVQPDILFTLGCFFVAIGLSFKVAAAPFHFWSPDVYEGSPTLITAFMSTVVKMAAFIGLYRFVGITQMPPTLGKALLVMTIFTLMIGNIVALRQSHFKRLMAYSSIAHSGFLLMAVLSQAPNTAQVLFYYTFTYSLATVGLFILMTLAKRAANGDEHIRIFRGLFRAKPWLGVVMLLLMLSLAGIPLTAGFVAKYQIFLLAIGADLIKTTVFAVLMALVGIYYYAVVIREAFTPSEEAPALVVSPVNLLLISVCGISVVLFGLLPGYLQ